MTFYVEKHNVAAIEQLEEQFCKLLAQEVTSPAELEAWMRQQSQLFEEVEEILNGHYVDFQCRNDDEAAKQRFTYDQQVVLPLVKKYEALFDRAFVNSPYRDQLDKEFYREYSKRKTNALELFREENIPLEVKEDEHVTAYFETTGSLTVCWQGEERTLQQMYNYLQVADRSVREQAWRKMQDAYLAVKEPLQQIMDELLKIRHQKALHANLANYRDYMFKKYERFSYTPDDCHRLAEAVQRYVVPLKEAIEQRHQRELGVDRYRPWDTEATVPGREPLRPFRTAEELVEGVKQALNGVDPAIGELLERMRRAGMLDLESRKAKSPGGFCIDLPVSGLSFIFMNASGKHEDVVTLIHEMGHCFHNHLKRPLPVREYRETPMESSELASTALEFLTMDKWDQFYPDQATLRRAQREHIEAAIRFLPWGVVIDQFQHWMYEHPTHTAEERNAKFLEMARLFLTTHQDWSGLTEQLAHLWLQQLHIFEVPFYYIEYVIANLAALQMYRQYKQNPREAVANYKKALSLGSARPLPEVYEAAGIRFDFSAPVIRDLIAFVQEELAVLI